jgi:homoprotocatechuate degradation regulator HpaR
MFYHACQSMRHSIESLMDKVSTAQKLVPRQTRRSLPMALLRAREAVMENFRPMLSRYDVTEQQWRVMRVLAEAGRLDASDVAKRASILAPSLTRIIRALEERKLIKRLKDSVDGRRVILEISNTGRDLIQKALPESGSIYEKLEREIGAEKLNVLLNMLDEISGYEK